MDSAPHIAVVDDHRDIRDLVGKYLMQHGYRISLAESAVALRRLLERSAPDLVVLDIMMPGEDGLSLCRHLRSTTELPVILLTAMAEETDRIVGLEVGADDYVTKPFSMKELVARINANLKRSETGQRGKVLEAGDLQLDTKNFTAHIREEPLDLRLKEFELLAALASAPGELKSREELAKEVWGHAGVGSSRTIDVHIRRIRAALEARSSYQYIHTARGLGYRFEAKPKSWAGVGAESPE